jgi:hypothetical protein
MLNFVEECSIEEFSACRRAVAEKILYFKFKRQSRSFFRFFASERIWRLSFRKRDCFRNLINKRFRERIRK